MNTKLKQYTLDDGTITDAVEVSKRVGITIKNARTRLSIHTDPSKVFRPKQIHRREDNPDSYKMRKIMKRGMFDPMFVKAFKTI